MPMNELDLSREYEEQRIDHTLKVVKENCAQCESEVTKLRADIEEMREHFHEGDVEIWTALNNAITMHDNSFRTLKKNERALKKPYFGRIIFTDEESGVKESLYIGRGGISENITGQLVADWRAPIANAYYENGLGRTSFLSPEGEDIYLDLELKRTFDIDDGRLIDYADSDVVATDELLNKYLARNKQAVLGEIVATIQKEQNDIIRRSPIRNVLVQGAAGSGKTTVAMHRISYILYNFAERIKPDDFYIIGSNRMLLNYITGVLPELDVEGIRQMTMEELFERLLYEQWPREKCEVVPAEMSGHPPVNSTTEHFELLRKYCDELEFSYFDRGDVVLNRDCFTEGLENGAGGVYDRSEKKGTADYREFDDAAGRYRYEGYASCVGLMKGSFIMRFVKSHPELSLQIKVRELTEKLMDSVEDELTRHSHAYSEREKKIIRRDFEKYLGGKEYRDTCFKIYDDFLTKTGEGTRAGSRRYDVYDLAALAYIYKRINETEAISEAHHIVIDEAQDYGMMAYRALDFCIRGCTYTVMGDTSQNIRFDCGINSWEELRGLLLTRPGDSFCTLRKSYRNTIEISGFAAKILDHGDFEIYPSEPIIRHGDEPCVLKVTPDEADKTVVEMCRTWSVDYGTIAIVCRTEAEAAKLTGRLKKLGLEVAASDPEHAEFVNGIMVLPVVLTKGLEFDAVLIYEPDRTDYPCDNRHAKLLYVAATRALHELCVVCSGDMTGLIADEVPADKVRKVVIADPETDVNAPSAGEIARAKRDFEAAQAEYLKKKTMEAATRRTRENVEAGKIKLGTEAGSGNADTDSAGAISGKQGSATGRNGQQGGGNADERPSDTEAGKNGNPGRAAEQNISVGETAAIFGREASDKFMTMPGHTAAQLAPRWITPQSRGIYVQSRYGILRISPIHPKIIRITFVAGSEFKIPGEDSFGQIPMFTGFKKRENPKLLELQMPGCALTVDKQTGALTYRNAAGKEVLKEKPVDTRYVCADGRVFTNFVPQKSTSWYALRALDKSCKYLGETARFISDGGGRPMLLAKDSFGLMTVTGGRTAFGNVPGRGMMLVNEGGFSDMFFVCAGSTEELIGLYEWVAGANMRQS